MKTQGEIDITSESLANAYNAQNDREEHDIAYVKRKLEAINKLRMSAFFNSRGNRRGHGV